MERADFLIVGGGVAGLSAAARLAPHGRTILLEAEEALGYHSSGRSVSFSHYGIGTAPVRALTFHSRFHFAPPLGRLFPTLYFADESALPRLEALAEEMAPLAGDVRPVDASAMAALFPALRTGPGGAARGLLDPPGLRLVAALTLQDYPRKGRAAGGTILPGRRVAAAEPGWTV